MKMCEYCGKVEVKEYRRKYCSNVCSARAREGVNDPDFTKEPELFYYFAGFVYGDGCLEKRSRASIILVSKDLDLINNLHPRICPRRKIGLREPRKDAHETVYTLRTSNETVINKLIRMGLTHAKTKTIIVPDLPKKYLSHFIRGYFDADGSIWSNKVKDKEYYHISFTTGSSDFAIQLQELLTANGYSAKLVKDKRHEAYYVKLYKQKELQSFRDWIYKKSTIHLNRKHDLFVKI